MEESVALLTSSWLVAHGNMHGDEPKTRPLYWGKNMDTLQQCWTEILTFSQITAPIHTVASGTFHLSFASFGPWDLLHGP